MQQAQFEAQSRVAKAKGEADANVTVAEGQAEANRKLNASLSANVLQYIAIQKLSPLLRIAVLPAGTNSLIDPTKLLQGRPSKRAAGRLTVPPEPAPRARRPAADAVAPDDDRRCAHRSPALEVAREHHPPARAVGKALSAALDGFVAALGSAAVLTSEAELAEFRDPFAHATWDDYTASAVVMPTTVEEIQAVLRVANEHKVPLWTHGQGRNNGYGGPAPRVRGSVIVSLRNMNRVLEIDEECAYAVVEPGVRWFDLYDAIRAGGHKLWLSIADLGWGSVIGNTLDHGVTYLPTARTWRRSAAWRSCWPTATCCARAWARCPATSRGTSTSAASGRRPTSCSCSPTTGSSRRWACG